jgi:hypothetical protein
MLKGRGDTLEDLIDKGVNLSDMACEHRRCYHCLFPDLLGLANQIGPRRLDQEQLLPSTWLGNREYRRRYRHSAG